jgi:hypothetical protein
VQVILAAEDRKLVRIVKIDVTDVLISEQLDHLEFLRCAMPNLSGIVKLQYVGVPIPMCEANGNKPSKGDKGDVGRSSGGAQTQLLSFYLHTGYRISCLPMHCCIKRLRDIIQEELTGPLQSAGYPS